jgi:hypothetical protein
VLLDKLEREKCARTDKPRPGRPRHPRARRPPAAVVRILWERDGGRCKYISPDWPPLRGDPPRRAPSPRPVVLAGSPDTADAYELRCQRHNDYEGRLYFGKRRRGHGEVRERPTPYGGRSFGTELVPEQVAVYRRSPAMSRPRQRLGDGSKAIAAAGTAPAAVPADRVSAGSG